MKLLRLLLIISFSLLPLPLAAYATIFNQHVYPPLFEKYGVQEKFPEVNVTLYNGEVLRYMKGNSTYPSALPLNDRELQHMRDVKSVMARLIFFVNSPLLICFILMIIALKKKQDIRRPLFLAGIINLFLLLFILFSMIFSFDVAFTVFHTLFFSDGTWIFPEGSILVTLYPEGLFLDLGVSIFLLAIFFSLILVGVRLFYNGEH